MRDLERACSTGFWEGKCETKQEVRGIEENAGEKGSTGMWNETQAKQQSWARKEGGKQKLIRDERLLATREL